jgi:hypothetical protein
MTAGKTGARANVRRLPPDPAGAEPCPFSEGDVTQPGASFGAVRGGSRDS